MFDKKTLFLGIVLATMLYMGLVISGCYPGNAFYLVHRDFDCSNSLVAMAVNFLVSFIWIFVTVFLMPFTFLLPSYGLVDKVFSLMIDIVSLIILGIIMSYLVNFLKILLNKIKK